MSYQYLERNVLGKRTLLYLLQKTNSDKWYINVDRLYLNIFSDLRSKVVSPFKAVKFNGSAHVGHLRYNKQQYTDEVTAFINDGLIKRKLE